MNTFTYTDMKRVITSLLTIIAFLPAFAQNDKYDQFLQLAEAKDTTAIYELMQDWDRDDPDFYVVASNYYLLKAREEKIVLSPEAPEVGNQSLIIKSPDNPDEVVGYFYGEMDYNPVWMQKIYDVLEEGTSRFPDRIDLWFGLVKTYEEAKDFDGAISTLERVLDRARLNGEHWLGSQNEPAKENMMTETLQQYFSEFIEGGATNVQLMKLVDSVLDYNPHSVYFLSDKSALLSLDWQFDEAIQYARQALEQDPEDMLVAGNLAYLYSSINRRQEALDMFLYIQEHSQDPDDLEWAGNSILQLREEMNRQYRSIDIKEMKKYARKNAKEYEALLKRFIDADESLTDDELATLYFAAPFAGYSRSLNQGDVQKLINEKEYEEAYQRGKELVNSKDAFSLDLLMKTASLGEYLNKEYLPYYTRVSMLLRMLQGTGNAKSPDCAMWVTDVSDEYVIMGLYGMESLSSQSLIYHDGHDIDMMKVRMENGSAFIFYFNVDFSMAILDDLFK